MDTPESEPETEAEPEEDAEELDEMDDVDPTPGSTVLMIFVAGLLLAVLAFAGWHSYKNHVQAASAAAAPAP